MLCTEYARSKHLSDLSGNEEGICRSKITEAYHQIAKALLGYLMTPGVRAANQEIEALNTIVQYGKEHVREVR